MMALFVYNLLIGGEMSLRMDRNTSSSSTNNSSILADSQSDNNRIVISPSFNVGYLNVRSKVVLFLSNSTGQRKDSGVNRLHQHWYFLLDQRWLLQATEQVHRTQQPDNSLTNALLHRD